MAMVRGQPHGTNITQSRTQKGPGSGYMSEGKRKRRAFFPVGEEKGLFS